MPKIISLQIGNAELSLDDYLKKDLAFIHDNPNFIEYQLSDFEYSSGGDFGRLITKEVLPYDGYFDFLYAIYSQSLRNDGVLEFILIDENNNSTNLKRIFTAMYGCHIGVFVKKGYKLRINYLTATTSFNEFSAKLYY